MQRDWSRRDRLNSGAIVLAPNVIAGAAQSGGRVPETAQPAAARDRGESRSVRERTLLDFGWRFQFGHASDPAKDFGFGGGGGMAGFQKTGNFLSPSRLTFDDSDWKPIDLPHDWAITLPFQNDPELSSNGFYPLGRKYPHTSVGWYRRVFEIPVTDAGLRTSVEFDGAYRESMVVFNGFYIGRHSGGYDPFSYDLTDFVTPGAPNVLLVRVDATLRIRADRSRSRLMVRTQPCSPWRYRTLPGALFLTDNQVRRNHSATGLTVDDREVDLDLVETTGVHGSMNQGEARELILQTGDSGRGGQSHYRRCRVHDGPHRTAGGS